MKKIRHNDQAGFISGFKVSLTFDNSTSSIVLVHFPLCSERFFFKLFLYMGNNIFPPKAKEHISEALGEVHYTI